MFVLAPGAAQAQSGSAKTPSSQETSQSANAAVQLYTVPESPAFTFLDITPAKITKPTTTRDFVTSLINAIDDQGRVRQGLAFELAGAVLTAHRPTLAEYQQRWNAMTIAARSQLSLATARAAGDTSSTDAGYGIRIPLYDDGDPMADKEFTTELIAAFQRCTVAPPPLPPGVAAAPVGQIADTAARRAIANLTAAVDSQKRAAAETAQRTCLADAIKKHAKDYAEAHWNAVNLSLAYAGGHRLVSSLARDTRELGNRFWAVFGIPILGSSGQLLGMIQYANLVPSSDSGHQTSFRYGVRSTIGRPTFNGFMEFFHEKRTPHGLPSLNRDGWSGGLEFRVADDLWLATGFGKATDIKGSPTVVIANLKWALNSESQLGR